MRNRAWIHLIHVAFSILVGILLTPFSYSQTLQLTSVSPTSATMVAGGTATFTLNLNRVVGPMSISGRSPQFRE